MRVFISGSRTITKLNDEIKEILDNIMNQNAHILIGDAEGADCEVQKYLVEKQYPINKVTVCSIYPQPRRYMNNFMFKKIWYNPDVKESWKRQRFKDAYMSKYSDYSFVIWDGKSNGSLGNIKRAERLGKFCKVYNTLTNKVFNYKNKQVINVYYGKKEDSTNTRQLSNLAYRPFTWEGREYQSVEHAYQSNKSGSFDEETYNKYLSSKPKGYGKKIRGKSPNKNSLDLMKELVKESFRQNPEQAKLLTKYSDFTHNNSNAKIDKAFLEGLREAKKEKEETA